MDDNQFWVSCWKCVAAIVVAITVSVAGCVSNTHYQVTQALLHGTEPLAVMCAHHMVGENSPECSLMAAKH